MAADDPEAYFVLNSQDRRLVAQIDTTVLSGALYAQ